MTPERQLEYDPTERLQEFEGEQAEVTAERPVPPEEVAIRMVAWSSEAEMAAGAVVQFVVPEAAEVAGQSYVALEKMERATTTADMASIRRKLGIDRTTTGLKEKSSELSEASGRKTP